MEGEGEVQLVSKEQFVSKMKEVRELGKKAFEICPEQSSIAMPPNIDSLLEYTPAQQLPLCLNNEINALEDELELILRRLNTILKEEMQGVAKDIEMILYNCGTYSQEDTQQILAPIHRKIAHNRQQHAAITALLSSANALSSL